MQEPYNPEQHYGVIYTPTASTRGRSLQSLENAKAPLTKFGQRCVYQSPATVPILLLKVCVECRYRNRDFISLLLSLCLFSKMNP